MRHQELPGKQVLLLVAFIVWLSVLFAPLRISGADKMRDFEVPWTTAARAAAAAPLYRSDDGHFQFKYLPAFAVLAYPVSLLPLDLAKGKWLTISIGLLITLIILSVRLLPERKRPTWIIVTAVIVTMGKFYGHELTLGQVNLLFAVLAVTGILLLGTGRPALSAAAFIAAVVVKPYAVLFLPWVAFLGGWRALVSAMLGTVAVLMAPIALYGVQGTVDLHAAWWATVSTSTAPNLTNPDNVSLAGFAAKWLGVGAIATATAGILMLLLLALAAYTIARGRHIKHREVLDGALLLTLVPLISPQGWDYVFLLSTPAIAMLANYDGELPRPLRTITWITLAVIGLSIYDLLGRQRYRAFMDWSVITICFLIVIGALATLRLRRVA